MTFRRPKTLEELLAFFESTYWCNPSNVAFVCIDKMSESVARFSKITIHLWSAC